MKRFKQLTWKDNTTKQGKHIGIVYITADVDVLEIDYSVTNFKNFEGEIKPTNDDTDKFYFQIGGHYFDDEPEPVVVSSIEEAKLLAQQDFEKRVTELFFI